MNTDSQPNRNRACILFVDDEVSILNALRRLFHNETDMDCHFASSPMEALQILTAQDVVVLVSDHRMPQMTGVEFLARVKEKRPGIVTMMITGQADMAAMQKAVNDGEVYRFFQKPWNDEELVRAVQQAVEFQRLRSENVKLLATTKEQNAKLAQMNASLETQVNLRTQQLADALHTARSASQNLEDSLYGSTKALSVLLRLSRPELGSHCHRVAEYAIDIGKAMGFKSRELRELEIAALLHDGGKLNLPNCLIDKSPKDLNREETLLYRTHPALAREFCKSIPSYARIGEIIYAHHERLDGSGFPEKLKGDDVPFESYIIGIVDEYDHLIRHHANNQQLAYQYACENLAELSGSKFPSALVQRVLDYIQEIINRSVGQDVVRVGLSDLAPNMKLAHDIYTMSGSLLLASGQSLNLQQIARIRSIANLDPVAGDIFVSQKSKQQVR
ncbi:MAG: HD domain-containing phosphohydrolase [Candidatus Zixiibacteriota bacterium]